MKECTGHERIQEYADKGILSWSGNDDEAHESRWQHGGHGVISVTSNVLPGVMRRLMDVEDPELAAKVLPFMNWLFTEPNPIALNTIFAMTGVAQPVFRAPYWPYDLEMRKQGVELLEAFQAHEICGGRPQVMDDGDFSVLADWARGAQHIRGSDATKGDW
jgi:4-hydroxy-tetrahydrodipicolinate synthase